MKCLTLTEPWATLVAHGEKKIETRGWWTQHRGLVAIHSAKAFPREVRALCAQDPFASVLARLGYADLRFHFGCVLAVGKIVDVRATLEGYDQQWVKMISPQERAFGDYSRGRYGFLLEEMALLPVPTPARGQLGLWEWDATTMLLPGEEREGLFA